VTDEKTVTCASLSNCHRPCPALPCPALPCPALPCAALPCPAVPCPALPCPELRTLHSNLVGTALLRSIFVCDAFHMSRMYDHKMPMACCSWQIGLFVCFGVSAGLLCRARYPAANNSGSSGQYYSTNIGPAHFIMLNSYISYNNGSSQFTFLEQDLAAYAAANPRLADGSTTGLTP